MTARLDLAERPAHDLLGEHQADVPYPLRQAQVEARFGFVGHFVLQPADLGENTQLGRELNGTARQKAEVPAETDLGNARDRGTEDVEGESDRYAGPELQDSSTSAVIGNRARA